MGLFDVHAGAGHPRPRDVDGRDKPGHDEMLSANHSSQ